MKIPQQAQTFVSRFLETGKLSEHARRSEVSEADSLQVRLEARAGKGDLEQYDNSAQDTNPGRGEIEMDLRPVGGAGTLRARLENLDADGDTYRIEGVVDRGYGEIYDVGVIRNGTDSFDHVAVHLDAGGGQAEASHLPHSGPGYKETVAWRTSDGSW